MVLVYLTVSPLENWHKCNKTKQEKNKQTNKMSPQTQAKKNLHNLQLFRLMALALYWVITFSFSSSWKNPQQTIFICNSTNFLKWYSVFQPFCQISYGNRTTVRFQNKPPFMCYREKNKIILLRRLFPFSPCSILCPECTMCSKFDKWFFIFPANLWILKFCPELLTLFFL